MPAADVDCNDSYPLDETLSTGTGSCSSRKSSMNKLCRQVSIESPGPILRDCVFSFEVPVPEVPSTGARIRVVCAGACYRRRRSSVSSSNSTEEGLYTPAHYGLRDGALFAGYEVAGVVDELGPSAPTTPSICTGQRVILYPHDGLPDCYADYVTVPDLSYLIPVPDSLSLSVAAMLPTGALLAKSAVVTARDHVNRILRQGERSEPCKVLIVGTGGLALWAIKVAEADFGVEELKEKVKVTVATLKDDGFGIAGQMKGINLVQWNEDVYEKQLIERTMNACDGLVDIVIDFGTTSRSLHRSIQCLHPGGVVLISDDVVERLLPKFSQLAIERHIKIEPITYGSIELLRKLVDSVASGKIIPPPHTDYSADEASTVIHKLCNSEIPGRAILRFDSTE